jgi:hypothetical protein
VNGSGRGNPEPGVSFLPEEGCPFAVFEGRRKGTASTVALASLKVEHAPVRRNYREAGSVRGSCAPWARASILMTIRHG